MKWPWQKRSLEDPTKGITPDMVWGPGNKFLSPSGSGAMAISAALACVRVLAESVASLSWMVYRRMDGGGKQRDNTHYSYELLHNRANIAMTAFTFRERMMKDLLLHGNAYALIDWRNGFPRAIWPLNPTQVEPTLSVSKQSLKYKVTAAGETVTYDSEEIIHIPCLGDGIKGESVISYNSGAFGLALSIDQFSQSFFSNGAYAGGVLETDKTISTEAQKRLKEGWSRAYGRSDSGIGWHKVAVLEDGLKWKPMTVNPRDAMALESRQYQVTEIARMFRVPPHLIGDLSKATFSNIEHQSLEFVMHSLRPWIVRIEQEVNWKLYGSRERGQYFSELLLDSMLRGDIKSRNEAYAVMRQNGVLNADEWRERENLNPLPDGSGKKYIVQLNMQELGQLGKNDGGEQ